MTMSGATNNKVCPAFPDTSEFLVVDENYLIEMAYFFRTTSEKAEMELNSLIQSLSSANEMAFVGGKTAEALQAFIQLAQELNGLIRDYGEQGATLAESFSNSIKKVDKAPI